MFGALLTTVLSSVCPIQRRLIALRHCRSSSSIHRKFGADNLIKALDTVQQGIFPMILENVIARNLPACSGQSSLWTCHHLPSAPVVLTCTAACVIFDPVRCFDLGFVMKPHWTVCLSDAGCCSFLASRFRRDRAQDGYDGHGGAAQQVADHAVGAFPQTLVSRP